MIGLGAVAAGALVVRNAHLTASWWGSGGPAAMPARMPAPDEPSAGAGASRTSGGAPSRLPAPDSRLEVRLGFAEPPPARLPSDGPPPAWSLHEFAGHAQVALVRAEGAVALRARAEQASFVVYRDVVVDLHDFPFLAWSWNVRRLPPAGDVRDAARDDQAAQVYVVFPRWPTPRTSSEVIGYVWDTTAPVGTRLMSPKAPNVRIVVVESGPARAGTWQRMRQNVAEDYRALFGRRPPRVGGVAVMVDANDTAGEAEALFGDLVFSRAGG